MVRERRRTGALIVVSLAVVLPLGVSCSAKEPPRATESLTPRVTEGTAPADLKTKLLQPEDLQGIRGLPSDLRVVPVESANLFENPDPRGPCGAKVDQPDLSGGASLAFQARTATGFQMVGEVPEDQARAFLDATAADSRPGCPPWQSRTDTGANQTGEFLGTVDLGLPADVATAANIHVTSAGSEAYGTEIIVRSGGTLSVVVLLAGAPAPPSVTRDLAATAARRLGL